MLDALELLALFPDAFVRLANFFLSFQKCAEWKYCWGRDSSDRARLTHQSNW